MFVMKLDMQADVEEELFREKSKALSEIFEDLYNDGWDKTEIWDEGGVWILYFVKEINGRKRRIRIGAIDRAVKKAFYTLYDLGSFDISYNFDEKKYGLQNLDEYEESHWKALELFEDNVIFADRPVKDFKPSKHLIKYYYSKGFKMRIKTKRGKKYLYAMKRDPTTGKMVKRNLGLKT
ncbi:MAG: hypothetical protein QXK78_02645 [Candidatus Bathyarchaeia archaeon]